MSGKMEDSETLTPSEKKDDDDHRKRSSIPIPSQERSDSKDDGQVLIVVVEKKPPLPMHYAQLFVVEIFLFIFTFGMAARIIATQMLFIEKICRYSLHHSIELCRNITVYPVIQNDVQTMSNLYNLYGNLIQMIPAAILSLFISSWSDKYGRRWPLVLAVIGIIMMEASLLINSVFIEADVNFVLLAFMSAGLFGGVITIFGSMYSYASENTPIEGRTFKFAVVELCFGLGFALGMFTGGQLIPLFGNTAVFSLATILHFLCLLLAAVTFQDRKDRVTGTDWRTMAADFFSLDKLKESMKTCLKERENRGRTQLFLLFITVSIALSYIVSLSETTLYYCNKMYNWDVQKYTTVTTISNVITILSMTAMVPLLTRVLRLSDPLIGLFGAVSTFAQSLLKGLAFNETIYFIALGVGIFGNLTSLASRSRISKLVDKDELGKVFSLLAAGESMMPIFSTTLFTIVYSSSLNTFPGLVFVISSVILVFPIIVFLWLLRISKVPYNKVANIERLPAAIQEVTHGL